MPTSSATLPRHMSLMCVRKHSHPSVSVRAPAPNSFNSVSLSLTRRSLSDTSHHSVTRSIIRRSQRRQLWPYHVSFVILALVTIRLLEYISSRTSPILVTTSGFIKARVLEQKGEKWITVWQINGKHNRKTLRCVYSVQGCVCASMPQMGSKQILPDLVLFTIL